MIGETKSWGRPAGQLGSVDHDHKTEGLALLLGGRNWIAGESGLGREEAGRVCIEA